MPSPYNLIFFLNASATTEIYPLPLRAALPIFVALSRRHVESAGLAPFGHRDFRRREARVLVQRRVGEEQQPLSGRRLPESGDRKHTSELQSLAYLVCRLLLENKKKTHVVQARV